jgi:hypothetical protein
MPNKTGQTTDVDSITNSAVMALDAVFRTNNIPFAHRHTEARELLKTIIASAVADHIAEGARAKLDLVLGAAAGEKEVA